MLVAENNVLPKVSTTPVLEYQPENITAAIIKTDLYNKFDAIISIENPIFWKLSAKENAAILCIKVYPAEVYEYRYLKKEITKRLKSRFHLTVLSIELDW